MGKTTSSEYVVCLMDSMPKEVVLSAELRGHAEQTEEKMVARPDLGQLNQGVENIIWAYLVLNSSKIVDEFNRLPTAKQNILLDGIDRGNWKYLSAMIQNGDFALFATCNYEDAGNSSLIEPMLDRFDVATESKLPSHVQFCNIKDMPLEAKNTLNDKDISKKIFEILGDKQMSYDDKRSKVKEVSGEYRAKIKEKIGLELLTESEKIGIKKEIEQIQFSDDARLFYDFAMAELSRCQTKGMKRANETCSSGCHFLDYACGKTKNGLSVRSALAIAKYAKTLAWFNEKKEVTLEHIEKVLPYAIWHKIELQPDFESKFKDDEKFDPEKLYATKKLVEDIKKRFVENVESLKNYVCMLRDGKFDKAQEYAKDKMHPIFKEYTKQSWMR